MKYWLTLAFSCFYILSFCQSKITFKSVDSLSFFVKIENQKVNLLPSSDVSFLWDKSGKQTFNIRFANPAVSAFQQTIDIKASTVQQFELKKVKGIYQFFQVAESSYIFPIFYTVDSLETDSIVLPINVYQGATKCEAPIQEHDFTAIKEALLKSNFEFKRMAYLEKVIPEHCFRVEQIRFLISQLELEDNKLSIAELSSSHIYDFERAALIADDFFLERNKTKVKALFQ